MTVIARTEAYGIGAIGQERVLLSLFNTFNANDQVTPYQWTLLHFWILVGHYPKLIREDQMLWLIFADVPAYKRVRAATSQTDQVSKRNSERRVR